MPAQTARNHRIRPPKPVDAQPAVADTDLEVAKMALEARFAARTSKKRKLEAREVRAAAVS